MKTSAILLAVVCIFLIVGLWVKDQACRKNCSELQRQIESLSQRIFVVEQDQSLDTTRIEKHLQELDKSQGLQDVFIEGVKDRLLLVEGTLNKWGLPLDLTSLIGRVEALECDMPDKKFFDHLVERVDHLETWSAQMVELFNKHNHRFRCDCPKVPHVLSQKR